LETTVAQPLVICVILNTNRREDTLACLRSLQQQEYARLGVIVLDNACSDGSNEAIRAEFPQVEILTLAENRGYAGNNNIGIAAALERGAEWVLVLNEDIVMAPRALERLVEAAQSEARIGIAGPMVYHHDEPTVIQSAGGIVDGRWRAAHAGQNQRDCAQFGEMRQVDWVSGCAMLVRRAVIEQVGSLDARFFYYWEETEWCLRARRAGWRVAFVPAARIWHKGVRRDYQPGPNVTYYATRNRLLMMATHHAPLAAWLTAAAEFGRTLLSWSVRPKWRSMNAHRAALWQGLTDFSRRRWGRRLERRVQTHAPGPQAVGLGSPGREPSP